MALEFDLLGDPVPEGRGKPGATGHIATAENVNKVRWLAAAGLKKPKIAEQLGISIPTLNKHYFKKLSVKAAQEQALAEIKARTLLQLDKAASSGSVSAMKEITRQVRQIEMDCMASDIRTPSKKKAQPIGKKARRQLEAQPADEWDFLPGHRPEDIH